ncbi:hypothetical protein [Nannocystis pusilla]|uniref:hypothetical protein n=1 Tax=Nannocystis pusilla TaxID=889268 RepID=UPI003B7A852E
MRNRGVLRGMLSATTGLLGLNFWSLIESDSTTDTNRCLDALHKACGDPAKSKTTKFTYGRPIVATVLDARPFDGHVLRYGNQDSKVFEGKKPTEGAAKYGLEHGPPGPAARAAPYYIRELQEDLIWLGYLSTSRGDPTPGKFDLCTLGAVLGFKQDLVEVYRIAVSDKMLGIPPGTLLPESFTTAIWTQAKFVSPARIILDWKSALTQASPQILGILGSFRDVLAKPKTARAFRAALASVEKRRATLDALASGWPYIAPLERVTEPFLPFAPKPASKTVDQLGPVPANKSPKCADFAALEKDEVWSSKEYNARVENFEAFKPVLSTVLSTVQGLLDGIADLRGRIAGLSPSAEVTSEWDAAAPKLEATLTRLEKLLPLVRFWTLDSPAQLKAWLTHIVDMGTVDQPTAVYLKTLRQGGRIGPQRRPAYQLASLTAKDDYPSVDAGAKAVREHCIGRKANQSGKAATTMPESIALQFFGNESRMTFTSGLGNFVTYGDRNARIVKLGIDTNAHRKGSFDAVFHAGGDWYWSRGWGIGQATERDVVKDGVQHRRGLPIMPSDTEAVRHPKSYVDYKESIPDAIDNKVLTKYNAYSAKRDCTYGELPGGHYYDCHSCLKRFTDNQLTGSGKHGRGGVFVPTSKTTAGSLTGATGVFVDFERYTPYARGSSGVEDPAALAEYENFFGVGAAADAPSDDVLAALRLLNGTNSFDRAAKKVAQERKVDKAVVLAGLKKHVADRSQLPCSWLLVRMRYAGSGEQAFASLFKMFRVVGELKAPVPPKKAKPPKPPKKSKGKVEPAPAPAPEPVAEDDPIIKNIKEASEMRRKP